MIELKVERISNNFFKELPNFQMIEKETKVAADKRMIYKKSNVNSFTSLLKSAQPKSQEIDKNFE